MLSFTRSLGWELRGKGIHVNVVCPGWVKTEFMNVAIDSSNGNVVKHFWPIVSTLFAVKSDLLGNKLGLAVVTCGPHTFIQCVEAKILPSWFLMGIWRLIR